MKGEGPLTFKIIAMIVALVSGISMAVQGALNTVLGKFIGVLETTFIVHIVGTLVVALGLFAFKFGTGSFGNIPRAPWYAFIGGIFGVIIVYSVVFSISRLGVAIATTIIITGQIVTAVLIDHFGLFGLDKICFSWTKGLGIIFLSLGVKLMLN